jgi:hypothetical protein
MWRGITIEDDKAYVVSLVQDERQRRFSTATEEGVVPPGVVFQTRPIRGSELRELQTDSALRIRFKLATGQNFEFGAHGEWFTEQERADMRERGWEHVRWVTGHQPSLPPK